MKVMAGEALYRKTILRWLVPTSSSSTRRAAFLADKKQGKADG